MVPWLSGEAGLYVDSTSHPAAARMSLETFEKNREGREQRMFVHEYRH